GVTSPSRLPAAGASFPTGRALLRHQRTWPPFPVFWSGDLAIRARRDTTNAGSSSRTFQSWPPRTDAWWYVDEQSLIQVAESYEPMAFAIEARPAKHPSE